MVPAQFHGDSTGFDWYLRGAQTLLLQPFKGSFGESLGHLCSYNFLYFLRAGSPTARPRASFPDGPREHRARGSRQEQPFPNDFEGDIMVNTSLGPSELILRRHTTKNTSRNIS